MKIILITLLILGLFSCKKTFQCDCFGYRTITITPEDTETNPVKTYVSYFGSHEEIEVRKRKVAEELCDEIEYSTERNNDYTTIGLDNTTVKSDNTVDCELK